LLLIRGLNGGVFVHEDIISAWEELCKGDE
jgi:hypothetical protein